ncbi:MAG: phosphoenolpyruvate synthase [Gammaproteobacteria bacterium]|nr:MAG: phosphoenolpyruvate synthase [Gammaproteobacteria bacterium]
MSQAKYVRWFNEIGINDVPLVGGKNASLGEMYRELSPLGVNVPNGFATTAAAYYDNISELSDTLSSLLAKIDPSDLNTLSRYAAEIRKAVYDHKLSDSLQSEIIDAYHQLKNQYGDDLSVSVRSSATAEDLPTASFAGQHDSYLNIAGDDCLIDACRHCFASLFTDRAIMYRIHNGFDHTKVAMSVGIMKMVRSDIASSGVMFNLDTDTGFRDVVFITAIYGLGENIVQGIVDPDEFYVHKPTFEQGYRSVLYRHLGEKHLTMAYAEKSSKAQIANIDTSAELRQRFCITDDDVLTLADYAIKIEEHYSAAAGKSSPMDMEWAKDGIDGKLYIIQARPETVVSQRHVNQIIEYTLMGHGEPISKGRAIGTQIACGRVRKINSSADLARFQPGEVLLADATQPDWGPIMTTASAIITNRGGRTCHASIVARELGIPAVVGAGDAMQQIDEGSEVTISCAEGAEGYIYSGRVEFTTNIIDISDIPLLKTDIMLNLGSPERAFSYSFLPCDGVGLARIEFIINDFIKAHPMALLYPQKVKNPEEREKIIGLIKLYDNGGDYFVEKLSEGVAMIAAAFYPKPVIVRMSDFKSNEYASLLGGVDFEFIEENPMIGFRGAARYNHPAYAEGFALECKAIKRVRDEMGFDNVKVMIPFCRRVEEGEDVLKSMASHGLKQKQNGLEVYVMCELPNNVIQIDRFAKLFDGVSIGSNDLTQLVLGVDRDSEIVAFEFDERDPGVMEMIRMAIEGAHRNHRHVGICGQAPSDFPEFAEYLVGLNIDSISLNPDSVLKTIPRIAAIEQKLAAE